MHKVRFGRMAGGYRRIYHHKSTRAKKHPQVTPITQVSNIHARNLTNQCNLWIGSPLRIHRFPGRRFMSPTIEQVNEARELLGRFLKPTRLVPAERIGRESDSQIYLKLEPDLPTGSFKPRGAIYALMKNLAQRSIKGVVAASTGNHGGSCRLRCPSGGSSRNDLPAPSSESDQACTNRCARCDCQGGRVER